MDPATERPAPRASFGDHLRVAWLLVKTIAGVVPFLVFIPLSPVLNPWLRARARKRLAGAAHDLATPPAIAADNLADKTVFVVAGEASGDRLAATVVRELRAQAPGVTVRGYAGPACADAGATLDLDLMQHTAVGFFPVVASLGFWWRLCARTLAQFREDPPDLLLTVDFPGLNVRLAGWARARGIRTVHLVAPQTWAHTPWRIFRWRAGVERLLATFPFEPPLFEGSGIPTVFVGHPLFETPLDPPRAPPERPEDGTALIELWPGSRRWEIKNSVPVLYEAAAALEERLPGTGFVVRLADAKHEALIETHAARARSRPSNVELVAEARDDAPVLGALCTSGTATAELGVDLIPLVAFYKVGFIDWLLGKVFITAPYICLVNLILCRAAVPERVSFRKALAPRLVEDFLSVAGDEAAWNRTREDLQSMRERLEASGVAARAAGWVLDSF